jgi:DNA-binding NarL/FixJ family response regulator
VTGTRVVVVSAADPLAAGAFATVIREAAGNDVTVAPDGTSLAAVLRSRPALVVADRSCLEAVGGPDTVFELSCGQPPVRFLVLIEASEADQMLELLEAGAMGCVTRDQRVVELVEAVDAALGGHPTVPPWLLGPLLRNLVVRRRDERTIIRRFDVLSPREREVLALLAGGHDQDDIADILVISTQTVRTHIQRVTTKLGVRSRVHAAHLATECGLVDRRVRTGGPDGALR